MTDTPLVSIIIPHYNGRDILFRCLESIAAGGYANREVIVVDNASTDGSAVAAARAFAGVQRIDLPQNVGYAGGCNAGMRAAHGDYFVLLNNDALVAPGWLDALVETAESEMRLAALQPKIRSSVRQGYFDYAGAAGGFLDVFGFPFVRGRLFFTIEEDAGQYDRPGPIFWASGTCTLLRRSAVETVGLLDETFFAHMEEIDLNWRLHLAGFEAYYEPRAVVYHSAGTTLSPESPRKMYLNHRNNLVMLLKNYTWRSLLWVLPLRFGFEISAALFALSRRQWAHVFAILRAGLDLFGQIPHILRERARVRALRVRSDAEIRAKMYRNSIVWQYFVLRKRTYRSLEIDQDGYRITESTPAG